MIRILTILMALWAASPAFAGEVSVTECDRLAGHPYDPAKVAPGVIFAQMEAGRALMSCAIAFSGKPTVARFKYQYGRALLASDRSIEAMIFLRSAAEGGYAAAQQSLAAVLYDDDPLPDERLEAISLFNKAAAQGHTVAQLRVASFYLYGENTDRDLAKARKFARLAAEGGLSAAQLVLDKLPGPVVAQNTMAAKE